MNEILLENTEMPVMIAADYLVAAEPFLHMDRQVDFHDMIYVTEGAIYVTEEDIDYTIHSGEILFLRAGCHHYGKTRIEAGTSWYYVHFYLDQPEDGKTPEESRQDGVIPNGSTENKKDTMKVTEKIKTQECIKTSEIMRIPKRMVSLNHSKLEEHLKHVIECFHAEKKQKQWMTNAELFSFLTECVFWEQEGDKEVMLSDRITAYLTEHVQTSFHADEISETFSLSYKYLAATFKKDRGMSMQQYHNQIRMQEACRLLRSTRSSVSEIATQLGFTDALYFSRCFHQTMQCSPKQYRRDIEY